MNAPNSQNVQVATESARSEDREAARLYAPTWAAFEAWEARAAKSGSGMTRAQTTGAAMMLGWLVAGGADLSIADAVNRVVVEPESARTASSYIRAPQMLEPAPDLTFEEPAAVILRLLARGALSEAWAGAESALPEGWTLELGLWSAEPNRPAGMPPYEATAAPYVHDPHESGCVGRGETAAAAVEQLTSALQARSTEQGGAG